MRALLIGIAMSTMALAGGCAHRNGTQSDPRRPGVITRDQIERIHAVTALDAVQRFRGDVLTRRAQSSVLLNKQLYPVVFLGSQLLGEIDELRNVSADGIEEIRFFDGTEALTRFGAQYGGGVIQIIPRTG